jgi:hypothetical protein
LYEYGNVPPLPAAVALPFEPPKQLTGIDEEIDAARGAGSPITKVFC